VHSAWKHTRAKGVECTSGFVQESRKSRGNQRHAKQVNQRSEAKPDESEHGQELYQNGGEPTVAMLLISHSAGILANNGLASKRTPPWVRGKAAIRAAVTLLLVLPTAFASPADDPQVPQKRGIQRVDQYVANYRRTGDDRSLLLDLQRAVSELGQLRRVCCQAGFFGGGPGCPYAG
jgi:hypothetical protein